MNPLNLVRRRAPAFRTDVADIYWRFAAERYNVFLRRLVDSPPPWSADEILRAYKFCNVFRATDRVSQYLIADVAYGDDGVDFADRAFQILAFRFFSRVETWMMLKECLGGAPTLRDLETGRFEKALDAAVAKRATLYTGAFILCANKAYGFDVKYKNHVALFKDIFLNRKAVQELESVASLKSLVKHLQQFPLIGPFMAYQVAIDLNYSELFDFSEDDFTQAGPGAIRGIRKVFRSLGDYTPSEAILHMVDSQESAFQGLSLDFQGLYGRRLHAIDCQGLFCETDKYCRVAKPELASNRTRIKAKFKPTGRLTAPFLPPKWKLAVPSKPQASARPYQPRLM